MRCPTHPGKIFRITPDHGVKATPLLQRSLQGTECLNDLLPCLNVFLDGFLHWRLPVDENHRLCLIGTCEALCFETFHGLEVLRELCLELLVGVGVDGGVLYLAYPAGYVADLCATNGCCFLNFG